MLIIPNVKFGHGSGSSLPLPVLALAGISTFVAVVVSGISVWLQLRNYRKPFLQRMVVRIMVMVPLYGVSSFISLFSLEAAFFIDAIRDIYEAFVIYCFFVLLLDYLGGERSLLILLHGRPPIPPVFPVSLWRSEIDPSDPYTFLFLKRGILQYVQVKPILALASLIMKATGIYNEGDFRARTLWCLAVFWMCVHEDLKPFRPVPKFLCVKGILFFSFWQSIAVSFLVAVGAITRLGPYTDSEHISLGLTDTLICIEMPFFAAAHMYAFSYRDFTKQPTSAVSKGSPSIYVARMTLGYALRDAFGLKDLVEDTRTTLRGEGINYRAFEPSEGGMHIGAARERRIRAGLRYVAGGKRKYWLPEVRTLASGHPENDGDVTTPLFSVDVDDAVHDAPDMRYQRGVTRTPGDDVDVEDENEYALAFNDALAGPQGVDELLYEDAKKYVFGDYLYPVVDVSNEQARRAMWEAEESVVQDIASGGLGRRDAAFSGYGATQSRERHTRMYDIQDDEPHSSAETKVHKARPDRDHCALTRASPPLLQSHEVFGCPPMTSGSRLSSHQSGAHSPSQVLSRLHLSHLVSSSFSDRTSSSSASLLSKHALRTPLMQEDAVDLVVPATDGLQVPSTSRGPPSPNSPNLPALVRVWDEHKLSPGPGSGSPMQGAVDGRNEADKSLERHASQANIQFMVTQAEGDVDSQDAHKEHDRRYETNLPSEQWQTHGVGITEEEDSNPWA